MREWRGGTGFKITTAGFPLNREAGVEVVLEVEVVFEVEVKDRMCCSNPRCAERLKYISYHTSYTDIYTYIHTYIHTYTCTHININTNTT